MNDYLFLQFQRNAICITNVTVFQKQLCSKNNRSDAKRVKIEPVNERHKIVETIHSVSWLTIYTHKLGFDTFMIFQAGFVVVAAAGYAMWCWWLFPHLLGFGENVRPIIPPAALFFFFFPFF